MQSTGHTGRHLPHPEHSSGTMITSIPWLKMAPNCGGQWRMQVSQLMHSDISMRSAGSFHLGLRSRDSRRSSRVAAGTRPGYPGVAREASRRAPPLACASQPTQNPGGASPVAKYPFLSDEWIAEVRKIGEEYQGAGTVPHTVKMNQVITEVP